MFGHPPSDEPPQYRERAAAIGVTRAGMGGEASKTIENEAEADGASQTTRCG